MSTIESTHTTRTEAARTRKLLPVANVAPRRSITMLFALSAMFVPAALGDPPAFGEPTASLLASGLEGASGSTVGPGGALFVTEGAAGRISRIDPRTGADIALGTASSRRELPGEVPRVADEAVGGGWPGRARR